MNDTPPTDDAADDLEALYRKSSAQDPSRPSAKTRQAILEHSLRIATNRTHTPRIGWGIQSETPAAVGRLKKVARLSRPKWPPRPVLVGSLAAAALAGLLIGPQYLRRAAPPVALPMSPTSAVSQVKQIEPSRPAGPSVAETSESAQAVMNLPATVPAPHVHVPAILAAPSADAAESATAARPVPGASGLGVTGGAAAAPTDGYEDVSVTGMRRRRTPGTSAAGAAVQRSRDAGADDSAAPDKVPGAASPNDARDSDGRTALMLAVLQDRVDAVMDLLRRGADPNAADNSGVTPLQAAQAKNEPEIADALVHAGAR